MIDFGWGDYEQSYCVLSFNGYWTTQDFMNTMSLVTNSLSVKTKPINIIVDFRYSAAPPADIIGVSSGIISPYESLVGRVIIIHKSLLWKRLYELMVSNPKTIPLDSCFVKDVDEAYQLLLACNRKS
ncbi:MAG: hypothetical protein Phog2KO_19420 [Phototrophicaceae bacterium]